MKKLWGGRFEKDTSKLMEDFHSSISFDKKLYHYDIMGSIAHAEMLAKCNIIDLKDSEEIIEALREIEDDIENGQVEFSVSQEDIHMNIESLLIDKIGDTGKKLHTARSRNDQVALDVRLYTRDAVLELKELLKDWLKALIKLAENNLDTIMPGYTHLQRAQPISLAHTVMAHAEMAKRDIQRLDAWMNIYNVMPLGSGALAGTTFPIDRNYTCQKLGFDSACMNSIDGVSDRDYIIDILANASIGMMHLSRFCEELILWSSQEFDFIEIDDEFATGSSMMPQKKNPDAAELVRGKTGRVYGDLMSILTTMKGLPLSYNKDMQEDKEVLFDGIETWEKCLRIMTPMITSMKIKKYNMLEAAKGGYTNATDLADYLVKKGISFRDAHKITGEIVFYCISKNISLDQLNIFEYQEFSQKIEVDVYDFIDVKTCVSNRKSIGGPAIEQVKNNIRNLKSFLK
ncbi:argininosuccinate lyase [Peptostreptococcus equinus]|uniref:Argininosuccinate lyase n=1 Tax=Peptostreptococcus equinus TaxID=3003601 RepID=A0ABY7JSP7_9FIRM|nr:argininosuccinate lyase [Peptostreptococcus sp. CBA3647]WAW15188.1 argininosuccinate lyase [Peptostreptococcus sp. CBA3647]